MRRSRVVGGLWLFILASAGVVVATSLADLPLPTTINDFSHGGSQPMSMSVPLRSKDNCVACHFDYDSGYTTGNSWSATMMAQATRDPVFHAAMTIANQDADFAGEFCLRCHTPMAWIGGRSIPPDGSDLAGADFEGVNCSVCHRMVDPHYQPGVSPAEDQAILAGLPRPPVTTTGSIIEAMGNGSYVFDPLDRRRGPYALGVEPHQWLQSPFHRSSSMCASCHDVSNPAYTRQGDGTYALNAVNQRHPTASKHDMFPEQRTYSEWAQSAFASAGVPLGARYGSNKPLVSTCQDCHMPSTEGFGAEPLMGAAWRNDLARHSIVGSNTWVLKAVRALNDDAQTGLTQQGVDDMLALTAEMLRDASDLELRQQGANLIVRVVNQTGHKLPTGYPEGRRMWVNVVFTDGAGTPIAEHGAYDAATAILDEASTKVYEAVMGIDEAVAAVTGLPAGHTTHLVLNNEWHKDNRIPPRGFTNAGFASVQAAPVNYSYADGQYWDDTVFRVPEGAQGVVVKVLYQTTTREYIEFLRDANHTNNKGQIAYDQWVLHGKSAPAIMDQVAAAVYCPADFDDGSATGTRDGGVDISDLLYFLGLFELGDSAGDIDDGSGTGTLDGGVTIEDLLYFLVRFGEGC